MKNMITEPNKTAYNLLKSLSETPLVLSGKDSLDSVRIGHFNQLVEDLMILLQIEGMDKGIKVSYLLEFQNPIGPHKVISTESAPNVLDIQVPPTNNNEPPYLLLQNVEPFEYEEYHHLYFKLSDIKLIRVIIHEEYNDISNKVRINEQRDNVEVVTEGII